MKKFFIISIVLIFLVGCGKFTSHEEEYKNQQLPIAESAVETVLDETTIQKSVTDEIHDYSQYIGKTWIDKNGTANVISFSIQDITNDKLKGEFSANVSATPSSYDISNLVGEVNGDKAQCQFSDSSGNEGTLEMVFLDNNEIEATVSFTKKSQYVESKEGTFLFRPFNLDDLNEFHIIEEHSKKITMNSFGAVKFVPITLTNDTREPLIALYLVDNHGDIIFRFLPDLPRGVKIADVTYIDINNDNLKDFVIIYEAEDYKEDLLQFATIFIQREDGKFINDRELDNEINESGNNENVDSTIEFLQDKFQDQ